jgi:lysophospholipase L1-like esterase
MTRAGPRRAALALGACLVTLLALEAVVRVAWPQDLGYFDARPIKRPARHPGVRWELVPHGRSASYIGVPVEISSLGLRDRELALPKPPGTCRVVVIGDSVTFGYGVRLEETYVKVLEARLNAARARGVRWEVVNAGIEEAGLDHYLHVIRTLAPRLDPDLTVVGLVLNDIRRYAPERAGSRAAPAGPGAGRRVHAALLRGSHAYAAGYHGLRTLAYETRLLDPAEVYGSPFLPLTAPAERREPAWASSLAVLDEIVAAARRLGTPLLVAVFPAEVQLGDAARERYRRVFGVAVDAGGLDDPQRRLAAHAAARGVRLVDLLPAFRAAGDAGLYLRTRAIRFDPVHPSARGHRVAGEALVEPVAAALGRGRS